MKQVYQYQIIFYFLSFCMHSCDVSNQPNSKSISQPIQTELIMKDLLYRFLMDKNDSSTGRLYYHIGDDFSGETSFDLDKNGVYIIQSTATVKRKRLVIKGVLPDNQVKQLIQALYDAKTWETKHIQSKPGDDDPTAFIEVQLDTATSRVTLFVSEIAHVKPFEDAQKAILKLVKELSSNKILEEGH